MIGVKSKTTNVILNWGSCALPQSDGSLELLDGNETVIASYPAYQETVDIIDVDQDLIRTLKPNFYRYIDGNLVKNDKYVDPNLENVRAAKIREMDEKCNAVIAHGVDVETTQGVEHFRMSDYDLPKITSNCIDANIGYPTLYHSHDENGNANDCRVFMPEEMLMVGSYVKAHMIFHTSYYNQLKKHIQGMSDVSEILSVYYLTPLPQERFEYLLDIFTQVGIAAYCPIDSIKPLDEDKPDEVIEEVEDDE